MKPLALALLVSTGLAPWMAARPPASGGWMPLAQGSLVRVEVERAFFELAGNPHFFVHVRVSNDGAAPVAVDLRSRWQTIYPNQWGGSDTPTRTVVDERRATVERMDAAAQGQLRAAFRAGALSPVPAHGAMDYYAEFNASGRAEVDRQALRYVLVSLAGELRATDGARTEQLSLDWSAAATRAPDLAVASPLPWSAVPAGALAITR